MVGLFVEVEPLEDLHNGQLGLFKGGGFYLIGVQTLACVCIIAWSATISFLQLFVSACFSFLRMFLIKQHISFKWCI